MDFQTGTKLHGFIVKRVRNVKELNASFIEMTHEKTGAELCFVDNKAENKLFSVSFKTLPQDSTGVFHILEHSVLCGSEKYPVKEPFVDLMRGSMNTFLNAMTYPDKTVYPVSSRNTRDFLNLTSVYLDAVFAPMLLKNPNIFYQEGIHTEIENGKPLYKGVVFNEMKGALASVDDRIDEEMMSLIFPDNCYKHNSGGDPTFIPDLTYEKFVETYKEFYHPSNARFFLDGDVPIEETLELINSYLEKYEKLDSVPEIKPQIPVSVNSVRYYEISEEEADKNKAMLALGKIIGTWEDREKTLAAQILCDVLADTNESVFKRAVLSSGLVEDFDMTVADGIYQPYFMVIARNIKDSDSEKVRDIIKETANKIIKDGIDKKSILASINNFAFHVKLSSEPQGLHRNLSAYGSWLYGGDPLTFLLYDEAIDSLKKMAETGGFEKLLSELLTDDNGVAVLHMLPSVTLGKEEREAEEKRLQKEMAARTKEDIDKLIFENELLSNWQKTPDSPEITALLPKLTLDEINEKIEFTKTIERKADDVTVLYHPVDTNGIIFISMYFPLTNFTLEEITKLAFLPSIYTELPTERYSAAEVQKQLKTYIGTIVFGIGVFGKKGVSERCTPCLEVRIGILEENFSAAKELLIEILTKTNFDQRERIKELVLQSNELAHQVTIGGGQSLGITSVQSRYTAKGAVNEATGGYTFISFLHKFAKDFDSVIGDFISLVGRVNSELLIKNGLTISVTASHDVDVSDLANAFPKGKTLPESREYKINLPERMGIRIPAPIGFAVKGYHLSLCGKKMNGSLKVAANIISLNYLWNVIRVQGGAYGSGLPIGREGAFVCYSYRDPSPSRSLEMYDNISDFINDFCNSDEEIDKFIISAIAATDPLMTPASKGTRADEFWFTGITEEDNINIRRQMLATTRDSIKEWGKVFDEMAEKGCVCVVGNDEALNKCEGLTICDI